MRVLIIGAGNVATVLGRLIKEANHEIVQVISRNKTTAKELADELGCGYSNDFTHIDLSADLYLVAMSDAALNALPEKIQLGKKIIVHTAGAISKDVLKDISLQYGVLYPLQSLRKELTEKPTIIPLLVEANNEATTKTLVTFAESISSNVSIVSENDRFKLHVAAVVVNNFTNHLYSMAAEYCKIEKVPFELLYPLIETAATRLKHFYPSEMQTGPAIRKDISTLDKHLRLLTAHPKLRAIYLKMTDSIMNN